MSQISRTIIALCLLLPLSTPAGAQHSGPYAGGYLGGNLLTGSKATDALGSFNLQYKPAVQGSAVLGWELGPKNPLGEGRLELEYARRSNPLDKAEFVQGKAAGSGNLVADSLLFNCIGAIRDDSRWSPYVVIGLGAAIIDASGLKVSGQPFADDRATVFAYQLGGGVDYVVTGSLAVDLGYRFFGSSRPEFTEPGGQKFKTDYRSHSVVLGLRVGF